MYHVLAMLKGVTERYHPLKKDGGVGGGGEAEHVLLCLIRREECRKVLDT